MTKGLYKSVAFVVLLSSALNVRAQSSDIMLRADTLTLDGAWCWFADPRAIYYHGVKEQTYFSWVTKSGDIEVAVYNHQTGIFSKKTLYSKLQVDDHDNPSIYIREDGRIIVFFSKHTTGPMHRVISVNPEDITLWSSDYTFGTDVTYPYPFKIGNQLALFYRGLNWHPTIVTSADNGETFGTPQQFIAGGGSRPYARYCQGKDSSIHIAFTTGHPRDVSNNKIFYARYKNGKFYKADGTFIKDFTGTATALNIDTGEPEIVYNATSGKGWIWDITTDSTGYPVMVFASFPTDLDHRYHYARWNGTAWTTKELAKAGKWFPQTLSGSTESEPNYSGGISLDYNNPSVVYMSTQVNGVFEISKWTTNDKGATWDSVAITKNSPSGFVNVRPIVPRNHKPGYFDVLWMKGKYIHYTNYNVSVLFQNAKYREYDFGTTCSPANVEATGISNKQLFTGDFGFTDTTGINAVDRQIGNNAERDFVCSSYPKTFKLSLPNGNYKITVLQGDALNSYDNMQISANGTVVAANINSAAGNWAETQFGVTLTKKSLELDFSDNGGSTSVWILNSIKIETLDVTPDSIIFNPDTARLYVGTSQQLDVSFLPLISTRKKLTWSSLSESIATVNNGMVTARGTGTTYINAITENGHKASCTVIVTEPVYQTNPYFDFGTATSPLTSNAIRITESTLSGNSYGWISTSGLGSRDRGASATDELRDFVLCSSPAVFRVFIKSGNYRITVKQGDVSYAHDNMSISVNGVVKTSSVSSSLGNYITSVFNVKTDSHIMDFTFADNGGSDVNWIINSLKIESLDIAVDSISLNTDTVRLLNGASQELNVSIYPSTATNKNLIWTLSDENIATVNNGTVTAAGVGTAMVTATSVNGRKDSCVVVVTALSTTTGVIKELPHSTEKVMVHVFDLSGRMLLSEELCSPNLNSLAAFNNLKQGIYIVSIVGNEKSQVLKIIKTAN